MDAAREPVQQAQQLHEGNAERCQKGQKDRTKLERLHGGARHRCRTQLMVTEKMLALEAAEIVATGGSAHKVVRGYRKRVRANVRRLGQ